eukprot:TRINITY_DN5026_c0_g2_i1.p1 TRINITY_DN5026_c0_g2~~TRINITY_DN5026_c0_g2_i1.p1  ORF type:complete len:614 (+),score=202.09 TRINITY_DN5026_c0_g2_i1:87-1844(+)
MSAAPAGAGGADVGDVTQSSSASPRQRRRRQARRRRDQSAAKSRIDDAMLALDDAKARAQAQKDEYGKYLRWKVKMQRKERRQRQREAEEQQKRRETRLRSILEDHKQQRRLEQRRWDTWRAAPPTGPDGGRLQAPPPLEQPSLGERRYEEMLRSKKRAVGRARSPLSGAVASPRPAADAARQAADARRTERRHTGGRQGAGRDIVPAGGAAAAGLADRISFEDLMPFMQQGQQGMEHGAARAAQRDSVAPVGRVPALDSFAADFAMLTTAQQREVTARAAEVAMQPQLAHRIDDSRLYIEAMRACTSHGPEWLERRQLELVPRVCGSTAPPRSLLRRVNVIAAFLTQEQRSAIAAELTRDKFMPENAGFTAAGAAYLVPPAAVLDWRRERVQYMQDTARLRRDTSLARMAKDPPADYQMTDDLTRYIPAEFLKDSEVVNPVPHKRKDQEFFLTAVAAAEGEGAVVAADALQPSAPQKGKTGGSRRPRPRQPWTWVPRAPAEVIPAPEGDLEELRRRRAEREREDLREYLSAMDTQYVPPVPRIRNRTEYHGKDYRWHKQGRHTLIQVPGRTLALTAPPAPKGRL